MSGADERRLVLVAGVGRSGTSLVTGILHELGFHVPQPEIKADETNPRGFGEPAWVVEFHQRLMRRLRVTVFDARPAAWDLTGALADDPDTRRTLGVWLGRELDSSDNVVVKDPRIGWFLPLWMACSAELGVRPSFIAMLRHPGAILSSARRAYGDWQTDASRAASWLNVMLETERATRGTDRLFMRHERLLADWRTELSRAGEAFGIPALSDPAPDRAGRVDAFVDPSLQRSRTGWEDLDVPASVRELAEEVWASLESMSERGDDAAAQSALDGAREAYLALYGEAEAISQSSVTAVKPRRNPAAAAKPPTLRVRLARRVPVRYRKRLRSAARMLRPSRDGRSA
jgi:hypothetical protein